MRTDPQSKRKSGDFHRLSTTRGFCGRRKKVGVAATVLDNAANKIGVRRLGTCPRSQDGFLDEGSRSC